MKTNFNLTCIISMFFLCFANSSAAQEIEETKTVGDVIYQEYKENGINKALEKYREIKSSQDSEYKLTEWELNRIGYRVMEEGDMEAAEKLFRLNMEEYPQAANPRDSYADYLIKTGDNEGARKYLQESVSMAEKSTGEDEKKIMQGSKAKLAKLDKKHQQFDFLVGEWDVDATSFADGLGSGNFKGHDEVVADEKSGVITIKHKNQQGEIEGKRIIVYDAVEDVFDIAYIGMNSPMGIQNSTMKIKNLGDGKYEMIEDYEEDGVRKQARHELYKNGEEELNWVIFQEGSEGEDWKKVYAMDLKRNN